jgi:hypothetical protein
MNSPNDTDQPCATIYDGWLTNEAGAGDILIAPPEVSEKHLGFKEVLKGEVAGCVTPFPRGSDLRLKIPPSS